MPPDGPIQSPSMAGAESKVQQTTDAAPDDNGEHAASHGGSTSHSSPSKASSTSQTATGDKRKRGDNAGEPEDGIKRQMIALLIRGRAAAPPSYQKEQVLIGSEVQTSEAELSESHEPSQSRTPNQGTSEMQMDATEGQKFLGALFVVVSMNRLLRQRWELYEDCRGKCRCRCNVVETFKTNLEELEKKRHRTPVNVKHLNEIVEYRNQVSKFTLGLEVLKEETSTLLRDHDGLHDEVDAGVEAVIEYDESLKDDEALRFLKVRATFWKIFKEHQEAASAAAKSAKAKHKGIQDETAAIRSRMKGHFKQILIASPWNLHQYTYAERRWPFLDPHDRDSHRPPSLEHFPQASFHRQESHVITISHWNFPPSLDAL
ncbi:hypothetical protein MBLNU13_g02258t1 [Cladosporium sp. NU13]